MAPLWRVVVLAIAIALLIGVAAGGAPAEQTPLQVDDGSSAANTTMAIELTPDGDARWTVPMTFVLDGPAERESFESIATAFEAGESDVLSIETFERFADISSQETGRDMALSDVERTASVTNETGRLELQFTWEAFGSREGDTLEVGDAFLSPNGTWLGELTAGQSLVIEAPESFDITSAPKGFSEKTLRWTGPTTFEPSYLSITYQVDTETTVTTPTPTTTTSGTSKTTVTTPTPTTTTSGTSTTTVGPSETAGSVPVVAIVLAVVALGIVGLYSLQRRGFPVDSNGDRDGTDGDSVGSSDDGGPDDGTPVDDESDQPEQSAEAETMPPLDRELLSDEEYVEALVERNGGRMKQATIVTETGWSNAKVSQLLSSMAEEGRIEKLRLGRENLISFPDVDNGFDEES